MRIMSKWNRNNGFIYVDMFEHEWNTNVKYFKAPTNPKTHRTH